MTKNLFLAYGYQRDDRFTKGKYSIKLMGLKATTAL